MMKHQTTLATALATVVVLPTLGQGSLQSLENALSQTIRSIEVLGGLEQRIVTEPEETVALVLSATEAPFLPEVALNDRLGSLRREVSLLQMEADALDNPLGAGADRSMPGDPMSGPNAARALLPGASNVPAPYLASAQGLVSTGMSDEVRRQLISGVLAPKASTQKTNNSSASTTTQRPATLKKEGYSADPVGQAKACFNAGRFEDALVLLGDRTDSTSLYWKSRSLSELDQHEQAIALLEALVKEAGDTYEGRRAATDLDFARWRMKFAKSLPKGLKKKGDR